MRKVIELYRHGETEWNKEGRLQGWLDSPLTEKGKKQAAPQRAVEVVFSSDLARAVATAERLFPKQPIYQDQRLREIYLGHWQGQFIQDLQNNDPSFSIYNDAPEQFQPTSQETFHEVVTRMQSFLEEILARPEQRIAIVSHGVAIACLVNAIENRPLAQLWSNSLLEGGRHYTLTYQHGQWDVENIAKWKYSVAKQSQRW